MKTRAIVIVNEQHTLFPEQENIIDRYDDIDFINVPAAGWTYQQQDEMVAHIYNAALETDEVPSATVIFASPIPYLLKEVTELAISYHPMMEDILIRLYQVRVFHNDHREKVELPNGKIINKVAQKGWMLV